MQGWANYSPQAKSSNGSIWSDSFVFVLFTAAFCNSGVKYLQQRLYSLQIQKYYLALYRKSLPTSALEKRKFQLTQKPAYEWMFRTAPFIIMKKWNQPKCLSFNRLVDKRTMLIHTMVYWPIINRNKLLSLDESQRH